MIAALWLLLAAQPGSVHGQRPVPPVNACDLAEESDERREAHEEVFACASR